MALFVALPDALFSPLASPGAPAGLGVGAASGHRGAIVDKAYHQLRTTDHNKVCSTVLGARFSF